MRPRLWRPKPNACAVRCVLIGAEFRPCPYCSSGEVAINRPRQALLHREPPCEAFGNVTAGADSFDQALLLITSPAVHS